MHRVGFGLVVVGAVFWIASGAIVFSSDFARGYADAMRPSQMASAAASVQFSGDPRAVAVAEGQQLGASDVTVAPLPWYGRFFGNFAAFFLRIIPGLGAPVQKGPILDITLPASVQQPACAISIDPNSVPYDGSATVMWSSRGAERAEFQGIGEVALSGSMPVSHLTSSRAFALAVQGKGGTSSCYTVVDVGAVIADPPTCIISAHPDTIRKGASANIAWGSKNAVTATLLGHGSVKSVGGISVTPNVTTTYTLTTRSVMGKEVSCSTTVHVQ